jgi:hypothetical protein
MMRFSAEIGGSPVEVMWKAIGSSSPIILHRTFGSLYSRSKVCEISPRQGVRLPA